MKNIFRCGDLYWFPNDFPDIERFFFVRLLRKLGINYFPRCVRKAKYVFLREDRSHYKRMLVEYCRNHGVETYVVQEGSIKHSQNPWGHLPLKADYFLCPEDMRGWWIEKGMPRDRIKTYRLEGHYTEILFLRPFYLASDFLHPYRHGNQNIETMRVLMDFLKRPCVFSVHKKNRETMERFIPRHRIVSGNVKELATKYERVFTFSTSSVCFDLEMLGIKYEVV